MIFVGSVYSVVAVTIERYTTLKDRGKVVSVFINLYIIRTHNRIFKSLWKGRALILFIVILSISYNFIKFFELIVQEQVKMIFYGIYVQ